MLGNLLAVSKANDEKEQKERQDARGDQEERPKPKMEPVAPR